MPTKEEEFKHRLVAVLGDLEENGKSDPEAIWLIGSLAHGIVERTGNKSWRQFKDTMSQEVYSQLLGDFEKEGNRQYREGDQKKAYAMQALGVSLVATTQESREVKAGDALLNRFIEMAIGVYRESQEGKPN